MLKFRNNLLLACVLFISGTDAYCQINKIDYNIPFSEDIIIDGLDSDWDSRGFSTQLFSNHLGEIVSKNDLSANIKLAWNKEGLLVFANVIDDTIYEAKGDDYLYNADCIELFVANKRNGTDNVQFIVAPGVDAKKSELRLMKFDNRKNEAIRKHKLEIKTSSKKTSKGYILEALIPFKLLLIEPELNQELAFQIFINDRDNKEEKNPHSIKWHHLHGAHSNLAAYNTIILSKEESSKQLISVKCNSIDNELINFYIIGDEKYIGETVVIDIDSKNSLSAKLLKKSDYAFAMLNTPYSANSSKNEAVIKVNNNIVDVINLKEVWRIYKNSKAPNKYESDIQLFERLDAQNPPPKKAILFVGDSNIRLWKNLKKDMDGLTVINRGFGGSKSEDLLLYADRIILPYKPKAIVIGSGGNDVNARIAAEITLSNYHELINKIHKALPETKILLLSTKPSISSPKSIPLKNALNSEIVKIAGKYDFVKYINVFDPLFDKEGNLSDDLYIYDKAHLSEKGYLIWKPIVKKELLKLYK